MNKVYKCKETFYVDKYDEDGFYTNEQIVIEKGSKWECDEEDKSMMIGNYNEHIHLERDKSKGYEWIEISKELFEEYFEIVKVGGIDD